jgi:hypothetical protein
MIDPFADVPVFVPTTVIAANGNYETHPESYSPRVIVLVCDKTEFYELLRTGEAIPWGTSLPTGRGFDFWIIDVPTIHSLGVHRA